MKLLLKQKRKKQNNSKIGDYDNVLGKVSLTDSCYLYFYEYIKPDLNDARITLNISDAKIMTLDIVWNGYGSWEMPNIEKFIITGFRDFKLEQASGPFEIDLNTLNLDVGGYNKLVIKAVDHFCININKF